MLALNATITIIHYVLIFLKIIPIKGDINTIIEFTFADIIATVIPSLIGAYKLWQLKKSGWVLAMIASGGYFHGILVLLTQSIMESHFGFMNFVSIYFILFSILLTTYLWRQRELFSL